MVIISCDNVELCTNVFDKVLLNSKFYRLLHFLSSNHGKGLRLCVKYRCVQICFGVTNTSCTSISAPRLQSNKGKRPKEFFKSTAAQRFLDAHDDVLRGSFSARHTAKFFHRETELSRQ